MHRLIKGQFENLKVTLPDSLRALIARRIELMAELVDVEEGMQMVEATMRAAHIAYAEPEHIRLMDSTAHDEQDAA